ncbi:hypothetical protein FACS189493_4260 [Spirochaetia bacterium]|nr:hypothetical protein FACS189493_4260 [Spirochaetia bacterium]
MKAIAVSALALAACAHGDRAGFHAAVREARYIPGVYEGVGRGFRGTVHVAVEVDGSGFLGIEILEHDDDPLVGGAAMEELLELVLETDAADIDAVSGATESSEGFLAAVEDALRQAESAQTGNAKVGDP